MLLNLPNTFFTHDWWTKHFFHPRFMYQTLLSCTIMYQTLLSCMIDVPNTSFKHDWWTKHFFHPRFMYQTLLSCKINDETLLSAKIRFKLNCHTHIISRKCFKKLASAKNLHKLFGVGPRNFSVNIFSKSLWNTIVYKKIKI